MIQRNTKVTIADNSGAKVGKIIGFKGKSNTKIGRIGDIVTISVQSAIPRGNIKKHQVEKAVVVRTRKELRRQDGTYIKFDENAVVILDGNKKTPRASRVFGPIARELKEKGFDKIISLAPEVL